MPWRSPGTMQEFSRFLQEIATGYALTMTCLFATCSKIRCHRETRQGRGDLPVQSPKFVIPTKRSAWRNLRTCSDISGQIGAKIPRRKLLYDCHRQSF